jgi:hypothetical protein
MEGNRFGLGLIVGLLVALAVVAATGGFGSLSGTASLSPAGRANVQSTVLSAVTTATESMSSTSSLRAATTSGSSSFSIPENGTYGVAATSTSVSRSTSSGAPLASITGSVGTSVPGPTYSSRVEKIAQQPPLSNAVILVPVLVAFLLGAFLYRLSIRDREPPGV